jgi:hypothetical protein
VVTTPFSFANGLLTANGRPQRALIHQQHASTLASLYPNNTDAEVTV